MDAQPTACTASGLILRSRFTWGAVEAEARAEARVNGPVVHQGHWMRLR